MAVVNRQRSIPFNLMQIGAPKVLVCIAASKKTVHVKVLPTISPTCNSIVIEVLLLGWTDLPRNGPYEFFELFAGKGAATQQWLGP